jgi:hypothetical protein
MASERSGLRPDAHRLASFHQPARNPAMSSAGGAPPAGIAFHGARAEASRRMARCAQNAPKHACAWNAQAGLRLCLRRCRDRRHSQAQTNPKLAARRTNPGRTRVRTNPGCVGTDRTQAGSKVAATRALRNPNDPDAGRSLDEVAPSMRDPCRSGGSLCPDCTLRSGASTRCQGRGAWAT